ncbi:hypothetical protein ASPZODRAFT_1594180 [Penicilliopsis zonata CBS 506.65]|uniref:Uncharacterized protein n=1 Tax=Penicilliopsis zonata CBS 506.65 TaxID=1073090 RepID=A0A1L9SMI2_9EURO|nr:hypothetical protein ASPZODRAFT_1594180 [Penicilliopsis zonata CBS 506.65]OJJ48420.1 hypothetical protein ASPZODRAFT_1594180 [Penicilliopsis zonata CBS 506.65]
MPSPRKMIHDIETNTYRFWSDPPFAHTRDEDVSPLDEAVALREPQYGRLATPAQRGRYLALVEESVDFVRAELNVNINTTVDVNVDDNMEIHLLFACYRVDHHIHQHYLARSSVLTLVRDTDELHELRRWMWTVSSPRYNWNSTSSHEIGSMQKPGDKVRRWRWPRDHLAMMHQVAQWRRQWRLRQLRVLESRVKWARIMEERRWQRFVLMLWISHTSVN